MDFFQHLSLISYDLYSTVLLLRHAVTCLRALFIYGAPHIAGCRFATRVAAAALVFALTATTAALAFAIRAKLGDDLAACTALRRSRSGRPRDRVAELIGHSITRCLHEMTTLDEVDSLHLRRADVEKVAL